MSLTSIKLKSWAALEQIFPSRGSLMNSSELLCHSCLHILAPGQNKRIEPPKSRAHSRERDFQTPDYSLTKQQFNKGFQVIRIKQLQRAKKPEGRLHNRSAFCRSTFWKGPLSSSKFIEPVSSQFSSGDQKIYAEDLWTSSLDSVVCWVSSTEQQQIVSQSAAKGSESCSFRLCWRNMLCLCWRNML